MRTNCLSFLLFVVLSIGLHSFSCAQNFSIDGVGDTVEILIDHWGIPHIYADSETDLFFAQGFNAARDRLFQFEVWRRQATGTVAEILGERELKRDIGTRLFQFRGNITDEMNHYHDRGEHIITSYVQGVNAYIVWTEQHPEALPIEFELLGIKPQAWTPEVVISRHQGLLGNIGSELEIGRMVAKIGTDITRQLNWFHPDEPILELDSKIDPEHLKMDILGLYNAYRRPVQFRPEDLVADAQNDPDTYKDMAWLDQEAEKDFYREDIHHLGSNNWVISGEHSQSGYPMMANDPHRRQSVPSLRYMTHLVGPGWNVIGGGEPEIPGISIGHNEHGAWGLTVYRTDAEDLYVYQTHPDNPNQYWYKGAWEGMRIIQDTIPVKDQEAVVVEHKYTRHGPMVYEDTEKHIAYAVRCGWLEIGGSPYLASLRMDQAETFEAFREACNYSNIPGENMVWADRAGNIGWQAVGIAPVRRNWSGLVPVPGDGSYEWDGYLPIIAKPHVYNPESGIFATANENVTPRSYPHRDALGFSWSDPYRGNRVAELLNNGRKHSLMDLANYQTDYLSIPARTLVPLLKHLSSTDKYVKEAQERLLDWDDFQLDRESVEAAIYVAWERQLKREMIRLVVPKDLQAGFYLQHKLLIDWLILPDGKFGSHPLSGRDQFLMSCLEGAVADLREKYGNDPDKWVYGQESYKHIHLKHPLSNAVKADIRPKLDVGPAPRGGNGYTVGSTGSGNNQPSGASFRLIVDTGNWDHCLGTNSPGQSGNPDDSFYKNLFDSWANDQFFPVYYSREKVKSVTAKKLLLVPQK
ncbi:MAG: penicillin acylase family protein [Bacteroidota bacterium]